MKRIIAPRWFPAPGAEEVVYECMSFSHRCSLEASRQQRECKNAGLGRSGDRETKLLLYVRPVSLTKVEIEATAVIPDA